ncbi:MAG: molecular chaperone HtpG [Candidatus Promineifilaceae bacterium]
MSTENSHQFKAEIKQLLQILIHSLYQDQEIFLRELISNASDALTRVKFEMLTNSEVRDPEAELAIRLDVVDTDDEKTLIIKDSGIGLTADEMVQNLGTIAQSGAREFMSKLEDGQASPTDIIGQFGVGFYSVFMVAKEVRVVSLSHDPNSEAAAWISDGGESYQVEPSDKSDRGTEIHITLKSDAADFVDKLKLRQIIKKHSDYVSYPIYIEEEQANSQESLWRQKPREVEEDAYKDFYRQMTMDFEEPLSTIHFHSDMPVNLRTMLFLPAKREKMMFALRKEPGVKLYTNNVLIQEYCTDLLPDWLNFVDGVVDSEDLPLNVSRETVQNNRLMKQLGKVVRKRVIRTISQMSDKDPEKFEKFWKEYGRVLKEGLAVDAESKDQIVPLMHFVSSKSEGKLTSLKAYAERMPEEQEEIYYVVANGLGSAENSPHLDPLKAKDWEVLYFVDPIDSFITQGWSEFADMKLVNVEDADIELPEDDNEDNDEESASEAGLGLFVTRAGEQLGERVTEVKVSKVLRGSPVRLVMPEDGAGNANFDRIQKLMNQDYEVPARVMEVNKSHPIIVNIASTLESDDSAEIINLTIEQLYESALVQEGLHPNPAAMLPRIQQLMEIATRG